MIFGDHVTAPETAEAGMWIERAYRGRGGTVGRLVPRQYDAVLRVHAPDPDLEDWSAEYRRLYAVIATVAERYTSTPDRAWFAVWEGHGFANSTMRVAWHDPPVDDEERRARWMEQSRLRFESERRNAEIRAALSQLPRFGPLYRIYYLLQGPVAAVTRLRDPAYEDEWRNPDLFWPDDRLWFVATDVDFWSLYVGGRNEFVDELVAAVPTPTERITFDYALEIED